MLNTNNFAVSFISVVLASYALAGTASAQAIGSSDKSNCTELAAYRDTQLLKDFDTATAQYNVFKNGILDQEAIKNETQRLMDDNWWAGETGARIAIEVKVYTDLFNDVVGAIAPEEYLVDKLGKLPSQLYHLTTATGVTVDLVKTTAQEGAQKAAYDAGVELLKEIAGQAGSFASAGLDLNTYNERKEGMAQYRTEIRQRVSDIDKAISRYLEKMAQSQARLQTITDTVAAIDQACRAQVSVEGIVMDQKGKPMKGAIVTVSALNPPGQKGLQFKTDSAGRFASPMLESADYKVALMVSGKERDSVSIGNSRTGAVIVNFDLKELTAQEKASEDRKRAAEKVAADQKRAERKTNGGGSWWGVLGAVAVGVAAGMESSSVGVDQPATTDNRAGLPTNQPSTSSPTNQTTGQCGKYWCR